MAQNGEQPPYEKPAELIKWPPVRGMSLAERGHPPGGRCLKVCYCGLCPQYKPLPKSRPAPASRGTASTKRMAESWKTREEPTWIDKQ
jgi:hypothetical protein